MFDQSKPYLKMLALVPQLKSQYGLKIVVISNESRVLNAHRIHTYALDHFVDTFISSCFVGIRKPDLDIFRLALDVSQTVPEQAVFIDNTPMFAEIAERLGMHSIVHHGYASTYEELVSLGLLIADNT
jgi:putative hydrolase of the HAD superfamily